MGYRKESMLRKITVAYGVANLLSHISRSRQETFGALQKICSADNFVVRVSEESTEGKAYGDPEESMDRGWEVIGVDMISPPLRSRIIAPSFSGHDFFIESKAGIVGRDVEVEIATPFADDRAAARERSDEITTCYFLGVLLYRVFSRVHPRQPKLHQGHDLGVPGDDDEKIGDDDEDIIEEPFIKKKNPGPFFDGDGIFSPTPLSVEENTFAQIPSISEEKNGVERRAPPRTPSRYVPLTECGCPPSVWLLVRNLLDCGLGVFRTDDSYPSLEVAIADLRLLLRDPGRFLFEHYELDGQTKSSMQERRRLRRNDKLYGREAETSQITEAFCRVATYGESEAFFVRGFSGSGKVSFLSSRDL